MKRIALRIIIITVLIFGCNNLTINSQVNTITRVEEKPNKTYEDETHKNIQYGELSFSIGSYHIVSYTSSDNIETFKCEIDQGEGYPWTKAHMTVTVRAMEKQEFLDRQSIVAYFNEIYPNYEKIKIYNNVTDNSGITNLYIVSQGEQTKYLVSCKKACYLIESDVDEIYLLKNYPSEYYEVLSQKIECANTNIANVNETVFYNKNEFEKAEYHIIQGKDETEYSAELSRDEEYQYHFTLKNEKGKKLLALSTYGEFYDVINILDVNMDGYADIRFLKEPGTFNNSFSLYVWEDSAKIFVKVKCEEMLSEFAVHEGYLRNWQKADLGSGVIQKLVWKNNNTLIKVSEEQYHVD